MKIGALCFALLSAYAGTCYAVLPTQTVASTFGPNATRLRKTLTSASRAHLR